MSSGHLIGLPPCGAFLKNYGSVCIDSGATSESTLRLRRLNDFTYAVWGYGAHLLVGASPSDVLVRLVASQIAKPWSAATV